MSFGDRPRPTADEDEVGHRLAVWASDLDRDFLGVASLQREGFGRGSWTLLPSNQDAVGVAWVDWGDALHLEVLGGEGGRWELGRSDTDLAFLIAIVEAVIDGRVSETFGAGRSRVTVTLPDGSTETETGSGPDGCLPRPLWTHRGRVKHYSPYK